MLTAEINLTESQSAALREISERTGKSESELVQEAVEKYLSEADEKEAKRQDWLRRLDQAAGIWKDRDDLPSLEELRAEFDRSARWSEK